MKITAGFWLLVCVGTFTHPPVGSAEDYSAYIRPLDKLRAELSQQQALLETVVAVTAQIDQLRNQETQSDILVLLDEDLSQAERIKAVLSNTGYAEVDELAVYTRRDRIPEVDVYTDITGTGDQRGRHYR